MQLLFFFSSSTKKEASANWQQQKLNKLHDPCQYVVVWPFDQVLTAFQPPNSSWWLNVLLLHSRMMFFHQQLCSPGTLIWQCATWTRSFRCSKPNTLLSSLHRLKVSPVDTHKLPMCSFSCWGDVTVLPRQGFCASADRFNTCIHDLSDLRAFGPPYGQGFCRRADLCHEGLEEQPVTGTFPLTHLVFHLSPVWSNKSQRFQRSSRISVCLFPPTQCYIKNKNKIRVFKSFES